MNQRLITLLVFVVSCLASNVAFAHVAWVWADKPTKTAKYKPSAAYQFNSLGETNLVKRAARGQYDVTLPGLAGTSVGVAHVVAYAGKHQCKVRRWKASVVRVNCFENGATADGKFVLLYYKEEPHSPAVGGYVRNDDKTPTGAHVPKGARSWNSSGGKNTVQRTSLGRYRVTFLGHPLGRHSHAVATALGTGQTYCKATGWGSGSTGAFVDVACLRPAAAGGGFVDSLFTASLFENPYVGGMPAGFRHGGFVSADRPKESSQYVPKGVNSTREDNTVERAGVGSYDVHFPGLEASGRTAALISARGKRDAHCTGAGWFADHGGTRLRVRCYTTRGAAVDSKFTVLYLTDDRLDPTAHIDPAVVRIERRVVNASQRKVELTAVVKNIGRNEFGGQPPLSLVLQRVDAGGTGTATTVATKSVGRLRPGTDAAELSLTVEVSGEFPPDYRARIVLAPDGGLQDYELSNNVEDVTAGELSRLF